LREQFLEERETGKQVLLQKQNGRQGGTGKCGGGGGECATLSEPPGTYESLVRGRSVKQLGRKKAKKPKTGAEELF